MLAGIGIAILFALIVFVWGKIQDSINKPRSALDEFKSITVQMMRHRLRNINTINKLSDDEIFTTAQEVTQSFKEAAEQKGERISGEMLLTIAAYYIVTRSALGIVYKLQMMEGIKIYRTRGLLDYDALLQDLLNKARM